MTNSNKYGREHYQRGYRAARKGRRTVVMTAAMLARLNAGLATYSDAANVDLMPVRKKKGRA